MSDNVSLKYLIIRHNINARQARWLSFLRKYNCVIKHIKGKENKVEDTLIHHVNLLDATASSIYEIDLEKEIKNAEKFDKDY